MAETLGSLMDKLTIKDLREFHLSEMLAAKKKKFTGSEIRLKLTALKKQKKLLLNEIDNFVREAISRPVQLRDEKLKLYNPREQIGRIPNLTSLAEVVSCLARKNSELWHLEDEARRTDVSLAFIGSIKKKIDRANQERNDYIDKIDELFERLVRAKRR